MATNKSTTVRFSEKDKMLIQEAKERYGIRTTIDVIRFALRNLLSDGSIREANKEEKREYNDQ